MINGYFIQKQNIISKCYYTGFNEGKYKNICKCICISLADNINMILMALSFLLILKYTGNKMISINSRITKLLVYIGMVSLGIYLIHPIFLYIFVEIFYCVKNVHLQGMYIIIMTFVSSIVGASVINKSKLISKLFLL